MDATKKARLLIDSVTKALADGVKHYSLDGCPLTTVQAVLEALAKDRAITLEEPPRN